MQPLKPSPNNLRASAFLAILLTVTACAPMPTLPEATTPKTISQYGNQTLAADAAAAQIWPADHWWVAYGDDQLNQMMDEALRGTPSLAVAQSRLFKANAQVQQSDADLYPTVTGNASVNKQKQSYNNGVPPDFVPHGYQWYGRGSLDFSYEFDFWGKNHAALAAATSERDAARADAAQARLTLTTSIAKSYADLAQHFAERDTADAAVKVRTATVDLFQQRYNNGLETMGSVKQVQAKLAAAQADLAAVDESIALSRNELAALMGAGPDRGVAVQRPGITVSQAAGLPDQINAQLLGRRPDIVAARLRTEAAAKRIDVAHAGFYPNVNLTAYLGVQSLGLNMLSKSGSAIGNVGPALSLPIFNTGALQGQYRGARADYDEAVANYDSTVTQALHDVADVAASEKALSLRLQHNQEAVDAAQEAYRIVKNRYEGGLSNYLDVLTAEDTMLSSLRDLVVQQSRLFSLNIALVKALGGGYQPDKA